MEENDETSAQGQQMFTDAPDNQPFHGQAYQVIDVKSFKPKCPYYQESKTNLYCPYFILNSQQSFLGHRPAGGAGSWLPYTSMTFGIIAIAIAWLCFIPFVGIVIFIVTLVFSILAVVTGSSSLRMTSRGNKGRGSAITGIILGIISLVLGSVLFVISLMIILY